MASGHHIGERTCEREALQEELFGKIVKNAVIGPYCRWHHLHLLILYTAYLPPTLGASGYLILILTMQKLRLGLKQLALNKHFSTYLWRRPSSEFPNPLHTHNNPKTTSHVTHHVSLVIVRLVYTRRHVPWPCTWVSQQCLGTIEVSRCSHSISALLCCESDTGPMDHTLSTRVSKFNTCECGKYRLFLTIYFI